MTFADNHQVNASLYYLDRRIADGDGARPALRTDAESWTYDELLDRVKQCARALRRVGVGRGDRVVLMHPDAPQVVAFLLAAMRIGAVPAPVPTQLTDTELSFICQDCSPATVIVDGTGIERVHRLTRALSTAPAVIVPAHAIGDLPDKVDTTDDESGAVLLDPDEIALLQYTSGSTGIPKGVVHLHRGLLTLPVGFGRRLNLTANDVCYSTAKLSFGYGLGNSVFFPLAAGASAYLRAAPSDPLGVLRAIEAAKPTVVFAGPTIYGAIVAIPGAPDAFPLSSVRLFVSAGDVLTASLFEAWLTSFGRHILDGLGSTECLHIFMSSTPTDATAGEIGTVIAPYEARLVNEKNQVLTPGGTGLLEIRGPANFARYWNLPTQTEMTVNKGWVRTGDVLHESSDGRFSYVGRDDDIFKIHEMKVSPVEIEQVLNGHPLVAACAVIGRPDDRGMGTVCAFVCLADGYRPSLQLERELRRRVRKNLARHKVPKTFEFVTALPRTSTGKLARHMLRSEPSPATAGPQPASAPMHPEPRV